MARILVVDDDPSIIKLYEIILKKAEFTIEIAVTGGEMMEAVNRQKPDVILLDVILPDSSGLDLCSQIKNNSEMAGIKIILVSGMEITPTRVAKGIAIGADDYLTKPFHPKELMARINNCLKLKLVEEALRNKNTELKELSKHLQNVREEERKLLAREVQEEVGQLTAYLKMDIDWLSINIPENSEAQKQRLERASETAKLIIHTIRKIASSLRPSMLDELGLNASLEWLCRQFSSRSNVTCSFNPANVDDGLPVEIITTVYRISEESLRNISQHAEATVVTVDAEVDEKEIKLSITDNGKGFDADRQKNAFGLIGMRERAQAINGHLSIESSQGKGTAILVVIPR